MHQKILSFYNDIFGVRQKVKKALELNKSVYLYVVLLIIASIFFFYYNYQGHNLSLFITSITILSITFIGSYHHRRKIKRIHRTEDEYNDMQNQIFKNKIQQHFNVSTFDGITILIDEINNRIEEIKFFKFPFSNIFHALFIGGLTSGLLSYGVQAIYFGNPEIGNQLLTVYLRILALIFMAVPIVLILRENSEAYKLYKIRSILNEMKLEIFNKKL